MNKKYLKLLLITVSALLFVFTSCVDDLDTVPLDNDVVTSASVFDDPAAYEQILAKCYAGLSLTGQEGPAGNGDLGGVDEGFSSYVRGMWNLQELPTDHAVTGWGDAGLSDFHNHIWTASNPFIKGFYYRVFYQITLTNDYIRETSDEKLDARGVTGALRTEVELYRAEARFLRALSYWHALDYFRNVPFVTENDPIGAFFPEQTTPAELFSYIESELLAVENLMAEPKQNEYGRADRAAAWMLLAKLYLNAEVYGAGNKYSECVTYSEKLINSTYKLDPNYENLFLTDNYNADGIVLPVIADGTNGKTWGSTTFIINGGIGGDMVPANYGTKEAWGGHRATSALVRNFPIYANVTKSASVKKLKSVANYPVIYVPGGYQSASGYSDGDWAPDVAPNLASVNSDNNYEGYIWFSADGSQYKFTEGPSWDVNWGDNGGDGTLEPGGDNLSADMGYYKINVNLNDLTYTSVKTDWGVIGDATPGGWGEDTDMEFDPETKEWSLVVELNAGDIKFRANDDWGINFGDDGTDGILGYGAANIKIAEPGKYLIKLILGVPDYTYSIEKFSSDGRALFFTEGQEIEISDITKFQEGYAVVKFKNISSTGEPGSDQVHSDTDFPMFRVSDAYLMYAEAVLRGGSGSASSALDYVNQVLTRAYGDDGGNITAAQLTLDFILNERSREFYWEAQRRTDLIRFGKLTGGSYLWPWKGNTLEGRATDEIYNIYPIPASDIVANINLTQNTGY